MTAEHENQPPAAPFSGADDAELVRRFLEGTDRETACQLLVRKYWQPLVGSIRLRVGSLRDAEEIAQDSFVKAFRSLSGLETPRSFAAWLFRIAGNTTTDRIRQRRPVLSIDELAEEGHPVSDEQDIAGALEDRESIQRALEAIALLPDRYRLVVTLRYCVGLSAKEIAAQLDEPEGTIRNRIFRAIARLRDLLLTESERGRTGRASTREGAARDESSTTNNERLRNEPRATS